MEIVVYESIPDYARKIRKRVLYLEGWQWSKNTVAKT